MKAPACFFSISHYARSSAFAILTISAFLLGNQGAEARGIVAVGDRGAVAVGGAYRGAAYRGVGYGYGYYGGYGTVTNVTNVTNVNSSSLPAGALSTLPADAAPVVVFGKTYFFANGTYYSPQSIGGTIVYVVANP